MKIVPYDLYASGIGIITEGLDQPFGAGGRNSHLAVSPVGGNVGCMSGS
jgi:hypothetical protein